MARTYKKQSECRPGDLTRRDERRAQSAARDLVRGHEPVLRIEVQRAEMLPRVVGDSRTDHRNDCRGAR
jgi:hypothetical protein